MEKQTSKISMIGFGYKIRTYTSQGSVGKTVKQFNEVGHVRSTTKEAPNWRKIPNCQSKIRFSVRQ